MAPPTHASRVRQRALRRPRRGRCLRLCPHPARLSPPEQPLRPAPLPQPRLGPADVRPTWRSTASFPTPTRRPTTWARSSRPSSTTGTSSKSMPPSPPTSSAASAASTALRRHRRQPADPPRRHARHRRLEKAARFVRTCDTFSIPIVTLVDVPGFLPGIDQEWQGIIRRGAKLIYAYAEATVPEGDRHHPQGLRRRLCGHGLEASRVPTSTWRGPRPRSPSWAPKEPSASSTVDGLPRPTIRRLRQRLVSEYRQAYYTPYPAAERGYVDAVIRPSETRTEVAAALRGLRDKRVEPAPGPARQHPTVTPPAVCRTGPVGPPLGSEPPDGRLEDVESLVEQLVGDDERWEQPDHVSVGARREHEEAPLVAALATSTGWPSGWDAARRERPAPWPPWRPAL